MKNMYCAIAWNKQGASIEVDGGRPATSIRSVENAARDELGSGWKVVIKALYRDDDGNVIGEGEVKTFTIR